MVVEKGYKLTEVGVIPEDWDLKCLGDIGDVRMCKRIFNYQTSANGDIPFYKIGTFGKEADAYISNQLYNNFVQRFSFPKKGTILISAAGTIGRTIIYDGKPSYFQDSNIVWIDNDEKIIHNILLFQILQIASYNTEGGTIQRLYNSILKNTKFICPPLHEQTAIANALSDMDALIAQTEKLIEKKKAIKQGVMQELLKPKEGWVTKKLGVLVDKVTTGKLDANAMKPDGEYRFYTCAREYYFIDQYSFDNEALLISGNGANVGYIHYYKGKFNAYQRTYVLIGFHIDVAYLRIYLDKHLSERISVEVSAGNTPYIKMDTITEMVIHYPKKLAEQSIISDCVVNINENIELIETKLQKLKNQKQGMMQALLTGKIRLV
jgi:type I restriction enzyme S subunit